MQTFSGCGEQGLLVVCGLLLVVASLVVEHGLEVVGHRLSCPVASSRTRD